MNSLFSLSFFDKIWLWLWLWLSQENIAFYLEDSYSTGKRKRCYYMVTREIERETINQIGIKDSLCKMPKLPMSQVKKEEEK